MDGLTVNRANPPATWRPAPPAPAPAEAAWNIGLTDALSLTGGTAPAGGTTPAAPPGASAEALIEEVAAKLATETDGLETRRLMAFAAVVASTADDPVATAALAQAWRNPGASEGAQRLHNLFANADEATVSHLYYTAAIDDPEAGEQLHEALPNNIFSADLTGASVLASVVKTVYDPQTVVQGDKQTCGAAAAQMMLAREGPAEYVRIMTGLAFEGTATFQNGQPVTRPAAWHTGGADPRSVADQLIQASFMDFANGQATYDGHADKTLEQGMGARIGLTSPEVQRLLGAIANRPTQNHQVKDWDAQQQLWVPRPGEDLQRTMAAITDMTQKGWSVPVLLSVRPNQEFGHYVLITRIEGDQVYTLNSWGHEQPLPRDLFEKRLITSFFQ